MNITGSSYILITSGSLKESALVLTDFEISQFPLKYSRLIHLHYSEVFDCNIT